MKKIELINKNKKEKDNNLKEIEEEKNKLAESLKLITSTVESKKKEIEEKLKDLEDNKKYLIAQEKEIAEIKESLDLEDEELTLDFLTRKENETILKFKDNKNNIETLNENIKDQAQENNRILEEIKEYDVKNTKNKDKIEKLNLDKDTYEGLKIKLDPEILKLKELNKSLKNEEFKNKESKENLIILEKNILEETNHNKKKLIIIEKINKIDKKNKEIEKEISNSIDSYSSGIKKIDDTTSEIKSITYKNEEMQKAIEAIYLILNSVLELQKILNESSKNTLEGFIKINSEDVIQKNNTIVVN